jgi:alpha-ribazole phosphatase
MATFFLIRHGEPEITGVMLGQMDPPLSLAGRVQSSAALGDIEVEVVWTSPLRRARETAGLVRAQRVTEIPDLREIDQGEWTGLAWVEIERRWGDLASRKASDWLGIPAPGGETWDVFLDRIRRAWDVIRVGPTPAAIIGHQGVNAALLHLIDGRNPAEFNQGYGEVIRFDYH